MKVYLRLFKNSKVIMAVLIVIAIIFLINIIIWLKTNYITDGLVASIKDREVVGVDEEFETLYPFLEVNLAELKDRNPDTVAWLRIGAIDLDIPIVQTTDNEYYLEHDIDKNKSKLGWVFVDTRNNMEFLGENTVLYGHNAASKKMFGSLKNLITVDPETKEQSEIIQLTTETSKMVFDIVSVYVTEYDDWQYVQMDFRGIEDKTEFIERMQKSNTSKVFNADTVSSGDQFLTFSTCHGPAGTTKRLVVHARLLAVQDNTR